MTSSLWSLVTSCVLTAGASAAASFLLWKLLESNEKVKTLEKLVEKEKELKEVERNGRINVQKRARDLLTKSKHENGYNYKPIGYMESPFPDRRGTPRQPILCPAARGKIRFDKKVVQLEHFSEIREFSHIWVLFVFHDNTNADMDTEKVLPAKIRPPRLYGKKVGCLSTRSPHRPNNIGLSVCSVDSVGADYIEVSGIDMVDGTPILDVKPYIPYDVIPSDLPLPMAVSSSGVPYLSRKLTVPAWIVDADIEMTPVSFDLSAIEDLNDIARDRLLCNYSSAEEALEFITQVLRQDIRGVRQGRGRTTNDGSGKKQLQQQQYATTDSTVSTDVSAKKRSDHDSNSSDNITRRVNISNISIPNTDAEFMCRLDVLEIRFVTRTADIHVTSIKLAERRRGGAIVQQHSNNHRDKLTSSTTGIIIDGTAELVDDESNHRI